MIRDRKKIPSEDKIIEGLKARPEVMHYLAPYTPDSAERFLKSYARTVRHVLECAPILSEHKKELPLQFINMAEKLFWEIQQKKLFNLQCKWRAEEIVIPGVECTLDFEYWEDYIESCPFLPPVTQEEVDLYTQYLLSGEDIEEDPLNGYQHYEDWKEEYADPDGGTSMPPWYEFYDLRMGTGALLLLPDIRGEKEEFYMGLGHKEYHEQNAKRVQEERAKGIVPDRRPWMSTEASQMIQFAEKFDEPDAYKYLKWLMRDKEEDYNYGDVWAAVDFLCDQEEVLTLEHHYDWREQLMRTAKNYKCRGIAAAMPSVYAGYRMRMETGLGYPLQLRYMDLGPDGHVEIHYYSDQLKKAIIRGRELNGEPADWNF